MMREEDAFLLSPLLLAYIGDAVWELEVRTRLLMQGERRMQRIHQLAVKQVRAENQAERLRHIMATLSEREQMVVRRGRNAKSGSTRHHAKVTDYRASTGVEALLGYLYLSGQQERLLEVVKELYLEKGEIN